VFGDLMDDRPRGRYDALKRTLDVVGAGVGVVLAAPLMAATAMVVALTLGRPTLFRQQRAGRDGRIFEIVKFRTMLPPDPELGHTSDASRMTGAGSRIRSLSLDELPSLWNVLKGDMSLVGPRPLKASYLPRYSPRQLRRHEVRPGLTGLAQVSGRNALSWDDRFELDVWYVDHRSLRLDCSVLVRTVGKVLGRDGITGDGHATAREFFGPTPTDLELVDLVGGARQMQPAGSPAPLHPSRGSSWALPDPETVAVVSGRGRAERGRMDWVAVDPSGRPRAWCGFTALTPAAASIYLVAGAEPADQARIRDALHLLITRAETLGMQQLRLEVDPANVEARRLFAAMSFRQVGTAEDGAVRMALDLT
jgi:lipopolysaccharide/colanic/teichoic acid biosynthesis glycosyltransferase/RimJ/RimL family protein N-acetyltransferase